MAMVTLRSGRWIVEMVVNDDDDNDGLVMDHIAANKSFQVNSVNDDDDHDDYYLTFLDGNQ